MPKSNVAIALLQMFHELRVKPNLTGSMLSQVSSLMVEFHARLKQTYNKNQGGHTIIVVFAVIARPSCILLNHFAPVDTLQSRIAKKGAVVCKQQRRDKR
ncbi:unnamed protein product [Hermetia illucens]|uniref:Uncharacterized protein n=1 Tax=Hermetia illucens TaxID=343691 RepID=A0A7R8UQH1_HERIL|nr:unnamed protein product [Hermetia illucens]